MTRFVVDLKMLLEASVETLLKTCVNVVVEAFVEAFVKTHRMLAVKFPPPRGPCLAIRGRAFFLLREWETAV